MTVMTPVSKVAVAILALALPGLAAAEPPRDPRIAVRLAQLSRGLMCVPAPPALTGLCIGGEGFTGGTAAEIPDSPRVFLGLTYQLQADSISTAKAGEPRLTALLLQRTSGRRTLTVDDITPDNEAERRELNALMKNIEASLAGTQVRIEIPPTVVKLLRVWSSAGRRHPIQQAGASWTIEGLPHELRRVGANWVLAGVGADGRVLLTLFAEADPLAP